MTKRLDVAIPSLLLTIANSNMRRHRWLSSPRWRPLHLFPVYRSDILIRAHAIAEALQTAEFGLFLVSVAWLGKSEPGGNLSVFVTDDGKPVSPVVLKHVVQEHHQLHGLEVRQLFRLESSRGELKCYAECRPDAERDRFALSLFQQIEQRLRRWMVAQSPPLSQPSRVQRHGK